MTHQVAQTILAQLGGNKFLAMTGASHLMSGERELQMSVNGRYRQTKRVNKIRISLQGDDTYRIEAFYCSSRGLKAHLIVALDDLCCPEQLRGTFEAITGLRTSL